MSVVVGSFIILAIGAIVTAGAMITRKSPVSAAVFLIAHFFCLSGLYLTLQAQLLAALQVLVYAGAIMVLVVFIIMLLNLGKEAQETRSVRTVIAFMLSGVLAVQLMALLLGRRSGNTELSPNASVLGTVESLGKTLFTDYIFPFEAVSILLLAAVVGSIVLAKRNLEA